MQTRILQAPIEEMGLEPSTAAKLRESSVALERDGQALQAGLVDGTITVDEFFAGLKQAAAKHGAETQKLLGEERAGDLGLLRLQRAQEHVKATQDWYKPEAAATEQ